MVSPKIILSTDIQVPRSDDEIVVRQFQPGDAPQVYALLLEGFVHGSGSPQEGAQRRNRTSRVSCLAYAGFTVGLGCLSRNTDIFRLTGAALCLGSATVLIHARRRIKRWFANFCATARKTDMANITEAYEIPSAVGSPKEQGPGGFWVAVLESPERNTSEVVGYVGLDYRSKADPTSAELRCMIVSPRHRRRRIGSLLMTALMDHARRRAPPLQTLELETIENELQPGPLKLYERYGFRIVGRRSVRAAPFFDMTMVHLKINLGKGDNEKDEKFSGQMFQ
ncbi:acyl-CoA N-acyltransferase [Mycena leptocephala]|nr:acyl-CoA N-acyltransferase [Mycena leptocephala]